MLNKRILELIKEKGFTRLTEPQEKGIPHILEGKHTLIIAPTGSGKTEAAFIPIFSKMIEEPGPPIRTIYITPLRSLNRDLIDRLMWWSSRLDLSIVVRHGDTPQKERRQQTVNPPDIMITTPETFSYLLNTKVFSNHILNVKWVVIDEIHELISSKRGVQLSINLERLRRMKPDIQVIGLSATIGNPETALKFITGTKDEGVIVQADITKKILVNISYPRASEKDYEDSSKLYTYPDVVARVRRLKEIIDRYGRVLIFTNTRPMAEILGNRLLIYDDNLKIAVHHSSIGAHYRIKIEEKFKTGELHSIVATSSLELGIDIGDIEYVVQYGSPRQASKLIQRIGRSGHWIEEVSKGEVITLDPLDLIETLAIKTKVDKREIEIVEPLQKPYDVLTHELAGMLIKNGKLNLYEVFDTVKNSIYYKDISLNDLVELIKFVGESLGLFKIKDEWIYMGSSKKLYNYYFNNLSMIPDIKQYPVIDDETGKIVGTLDDEFMALNGMEGIKIILAGRPWRIIQIYNEKVFVKSEDDPIGAVPDWIGEEIPVPHGISTHVGDILKQFESYYADHGYETAIYLLSKEFNIEEYTLFNAFKLFKEEIESNHKIPTSNRIIIEEFGNTKIINLFGGTKVNRTLEIYISNYIEEQYGIQVRHTSDQNRIILESPLIETEMVIDPLKRVSQFKETLYRAIPKSGIFRWRFMNAAKRMGFISKDAEITSRILDMMIETMKNTPLFKEALQETIARDFDIENAEHILRKIVDKQIDIEVYTRYKSRISEEYFKYREIPMETPRTSRYEILEILATKMKVLTMYYTVVCMDCTDYIDEYRLIDVDENFKCPICGSFRIGFTDKPFNEVYTSLERYKYMGKKDGVIRELVTKADLYFKYGKAGIFASAFEGLSKKDIENVLKTENKIGDKLTKILLDLRREKLYQRFLKKK